MRFVAFFFFLVVFFSSAELFLLLKVSANLGFFATFLLCVFTGILGGALVRSQGLRTLQKIQEELGQGKIPAEELVGGFMLIIIGALLMVPGFITDTMGFLLLFPPLRRWFASKVISVVRKNFKISILGETVFRQPENDESDCIETEVIRDPPPEDK